jgi:DNA repair protein SbcD/Mre11
LLAANFPTESVAIRAILPMRLIHTADWHLGHSLHGVSRAYEHEHFLAWLLQQLQHRASDALLIAGDIFDSANPPASAQALFYRFLREARRACPQLDIIVIAGNHDSAARLDAPAPLLRELGVHVIGSLGDNPDNLLIPLRNGDGDTLAWCAAVPFLRNIDLVRDDDSLIEAVRSVYAEVLTRAFHQAQGAAVIATGHCYLTGSRLSELSERKILGGNQHALPVDIFPPELAYTALGHLHLPQSVGGRANVRYSGSPLPLSLAEVDYRHQIVEVDILNGTHEALYVPRVVDIARQPAPQVLADALDWLHAQVWEDLEPARWPFLELHIILDKPQPGLRATLEQALADKAVRLLKITPHYPGSGAALGDSQTRGLHELGAEQVFIQRWRRDHADDPPPALLRAFHELLEQVQT